MSAAPDAAEVERKPAGIRAKPGHRLPHHGLPALAAPAGLAGFDAS